MRDTGCGMPDAGCWIPLYLVTQVQIIFIFENSSIGVLDEH